MCYKELKEVKTINLKNTTVLNNKMKKVTFYLKCEIQNLRNNKQKQITK